METSMLIHLFVHSEQSLTNISVFASLFFWWQIGDWHSWKKDGLDIQDIVWPGHSHVPPEDGPEKFHLKVAFLEEPPFINIVPPDPVSGRCPVSHGVPCHVGNHVPLNGSVLTDNLIPIVLQ